MLQQVAHVILHLVLPFQGQNKVMDTTKMSTVRKCVRPLSVQGDFESRKLWQNVTNALKSNDIDTATQHKRFVSITYLAFFKACHY